MWQNLRGTVSRPVDRKLQEGRDFGYWHVAGIQNFPEWIPSSSPIFLGPYEIFQYNVIEIGQVSKSGDHVLTYRSMRECRSWVTTGRDVV